MVSAITRYHIFTSSDKIFSALYSSAVRIGIWHSVKLWETWKSLSSHFRTFQVLQCDPHLVPYGNSDSDCLYVCGCAFLGSVVTATEVVNVNTSR